MQGLLRICVLSVLDVSTENVPGPAAHAIVMALWYRASTCSSIVAVATINVNFLFRFRLLYTPHSRLFINIDVPSLQYAHSKKQFVECSHQWVRMLCRQVNILNLTNHVVLVGLHPVSYSGTRQGFGIITNKPWNSFVKLTILARTTQCHFRIIRRLLFSVVPQIRKRFRRFNKNIRTSDIWLEIFD